MIDSSTQDTKSTSWKQPSDSADIEGKMLESAFSAVSISGNRPPALSVSSISSIGEDLHQRGADFFNYGAPASPLSSSASVRSHFHNSSGSILNSPSLSAHNRQEGSVTSGFQSEMSKGLGSHMSKYSSLEAALYAGNGHKSLPTFQEHIEDFDPSDDGMSAPRHDRSRSFQDFDSFSKPRRSTPDSFDSSNGQMFGNWQSSNNARSSHALNNMGSLDENEQYFGNRARAASATASLGYNRANSFTHASTNYEGITLDQNRLGGYSYASDNNIIPQFSARSREGSFQNSRQRVMSADAVHRKVSARSLFESSQSMGTPQTFAPVSSNPFSEQHQNRPRSFSSSSYQSSSSYRNGSHSSFVDSTGSGHFPQPISGRLAASQNDFKNNNQIESQASGRPFMHENQSRSNDNGYGQERFIRLRQVHQVQQHEKYMPYVQNLEIRHQSPRTVYTVKFKRSQKNFFLNENIRGDIKIGSYVKVEADRGEDLGIVLSRIPIEKFNPGARLNTPNMDVPDLQLKRITSLASESDIALLGLKEEEEAELLKICRNKTLQRGLPMNVVDAEYQFDRHKLTFFFEASCRVDFRELVRDLFSIYKTRIWMQQIDKVPGSHVPIPTSTESNHVYGINNDTSQSNPYSNLMGSGFHPSATDGA